MTLIFVTSNKHKFEEVGEIAARLGIEIERRDIGPVEIQADTLEEVASYSAKEAVAALKGPCFVEDAGLFVKPLNGFPGPYSNFVFRTIGNDGILKLMEGKNDRRAEFRSAVAYCFPNERPKVFSGRVEGTLTTGIRGKLGFGFDPLFVPKEGDGRTFAELSTPEKNRFSHRARSVDSFLNWFKEVNG